MTKHIVYVDEDLQEIIPQFLKNREEDLQKLKDAIARKDFESIQSIGHNLKGSGSGYGFHEVTRFGVALEDGAKEKDLSLLKLLVEEMADYMENIDIKYR